MIKFKKIFIIFTIFLFYSGCGYTPIFSKKDVNFSIEKIEFLGDKNIKEKINNALTKYRNKPDKEKKISLIIVNSKNTTIASKNSKGEAETNRISVNVNLKIFFTENNFFEKTISKSTTYSIIDRKSKQKSIEDKLVENLSNEIAQQIIFEIFEKTK